MKLTMLGTNHGVPSEIRYCSCYMLEAGGNIYLFDGGAPVIDLLLRKGKDLTKVKAFFNSHFHGDHILGIIGMTSLFEWYYKDTDIDMFLPEEKSKDAFTALIKAADNIELPSERVRISVYESGVIFDDGVVRVTAIPVAHQCGKDKNAFAFLIEAEGKSILYTGDMSSALEDFPHLAFERFIDVIISECAHFPAQKLMQCMEKVNTDIFVVTHLFPMDKIDEFNADKDRYKFEVLIAEDDDEIEF